MRVWRRRFQRTSEPVAKRSFDPVDRIKAEKARRAEFIKVALDMGLAQAVVDALGPGLEVGEHPVNPAQDFVRASAGDDFGLMGVRGRILVAEPAVGDDMRAVLNGPANETMQRSTRRRGFGPDGCVAAGDPPTVPPRHR